MLTVKILKTLKTDEDIIRFLDNIKDKNEEFYLYIINCFPVWNIIEALRVNKKAYLPSGLVIEVLDDHYFRLTNTFDRNYNVLTDSIFNY